MAPTAAEDLLQVFVRRHETASTLITTDRPTHDWGLFLGDVPAATVILDRFLAHATIIQMVGKSYRLRLRSRAVPDEQSVHRKRHVPVTLVPYAPPPQLEVPLASCQAEDFSGTSPAS